MQTIKNIISIMLLVTLLFCSLNAFASNYENIGTVAHSITSTFPKVALLISATSYIAGLGFAIGSIMKFKQHKDNPTNIPIGTPIALLFIAAALVFFPTLLGVTGSTMFGSTGGTVAGPSGIIFGTGT